MASKNWLDWAPMITSLLSAQNSTTSVQAPWQGAACLAAGGCAPSNHADASTRLQRPWQCGSLQLLCCPAEVPHGGVVQ